MLGWTMLVCGLIVGACDRAPVDETADDRAAVLASEMMSPFCQGLTLAACPSAAAGQLRREIAGRLAAGEQASRIVESLVGRFGERIRGTPRFQGIGLALWLLPAAFGFAMLTGLIAAAGAARSGTPAPSEDPLAVSVAEATLRGRLQDELDRLS